MALLSRLWLLVLAGAVSACSEGEGANAVSTATCPTLVAGENIIQSAGISRRLVITLPDEPQSKPVLFGWHWLEGNPYSLLFATGLSNRNDLIVVAPFSTGSERFHWHVDQTPEDNPDLILFDDMLRCLEQQFDIDSERVWSMGMSAGALWTAYLAQYRAARLASVALLSGGQPDPSLAPPYVPPSRPLPVLLEWGGVGDTYTIEGESFVFNNGNPETFSFAEASLAFSARLRADGHFVLHCVGTQGHSLPPDPESVWWPFLRDHPRDIVAEPYLTQLPADLSPLCTVP